MVKRNISKSNLDTLRSGDEQHTSTSEHVKTRPRNKKRRITPAPVSLLNTTMRTNQAQATLEASGAVVPPKSARKARAKKARASKPKPEPISPLPPPAPPPPPTKPLLAALTPAHLHELSLAWSADKRTPSVASRRAWAHARGVLAEPVHRWWMRKRQAAKRDGAVLPEGTYDLRVGTPPVFFEAVEVKPAVPERRTRARAKAGRVKVELGVEDHSGSSDTLVAFSSPPQTRSKTKARLPKNDPSSPLPPSSPPPTYALSSPTSSPPPRALYPSSSPLPVTPAPSAWSPPKLFLRTPLRRYLSLRSTDTAMASPRLSNHSSEWCSRAPGAAFTCALCRSPPSSPCPVRGASLRIRNTPTHALHSLGRGE
ncbi:hypothetical protein H0H81_002105 [Sphagnurus paluster]|uniref:Uncharacterized protein n=1 Tax=Sphagnurus paluster TaxID=117069 RepID=A0A9P7FSN0_9AGAR|nr:hypothetical protein H0H81_002105 [Sphagnurus paluster]